jgi:hypothetical protein
LTSIILKIIERLNNTVGLSFKRGDVVSYIKRCKVLQYSWGGPWELPGIMASLTVISRLSSTELGHLWNRWQLYSALWLDPCQWSLGIIISSCLSPILCRSPYQFWIMEPPKCWSFILHWFGWSPERCHYRIWYLFMHCISDVSEIFVHFSLEIYIYFYLHIHFIDPTFVHRRVNMKHVRKCRLHNATWSKNI